MTIISKNTRELPDAQSGVFDSLGLIDVDRKGYITDANSAMAALSGYTATELVGLRVEQLLPSEIRAQHSHHRKSFAKNPHSRTMNYGQNLHLITKSGSKLSVSISLHAFPGEKGARCAIREITSQQASTRTELIQSIVSKLRYAVGAESSTHGIAETTIKGISKIFKNQIVIFWEYDADNGQCQTDLVAVNGRKRESFYQSQDLAVESQIGNSIFGLSDTVVNDYRLAGSLTLPNELVESGVQSGLCLIVPGKYEPAGVIGIYSNSETNAVTKSDLNQLRQVADALGFTLSRQIAESDLRRELGIQTTLTEVSNVISNSVDLSDCFAEISAILKQVIPHDRIVISGMDNEATVLADRLVAGIDLASDNFSSTRVAEGTDLWQLINKKITHFGTESTNNRPANYLNGEQIRSGAGLKSMLAVGLTANSTTVGVLTFRSKSRNAYKSDDIGIAQRIAEILGAALNNSNLTGRVNEQLLVQKMLVRVSTMASNNLVIEELYSGLADQLIDVVPFDRFSIAEIGDNISKITYVRGQAVNGLQAGYEFDTSHNFDSSKSSRSILSEAKATPITEELVQAGLKSRMKILIGDQQSPLALIVLSRSSSAGFLPSEESLMIQIADQLAPALANAIEHQQTIRLVEELAESDARYSELFHNAPDVIISVDLQTGLIVDHNAQAAAELQYAHGQFENLHVSDLYHSSDQSNFKKIFRQFRDTGEVRNAEAVFARNDGSPFEVSINITGIRNSSGKLVRSISTIRDISDRVQAERVMKVARKIDADNTELLRLNQMRSEFLSRVSHELRTPLTALLAFASILSKNKDNTFSPTQIKQLGLVTNNGWKLEELINDLLDVSRVEGGSFEIIQGDFDIVDLVKTSIEEDKSILDIKQQKISLDSSMKSLCFTGDRKRISQVLDNLISNASKYSAEKSEIVVHVSRDTRQLHVEVADQGIGIDGTNLKKLFSPFFRVDNEQTRKEGGTGLGLAISKSIIELHGGTISVDSKIGVGTSVRVALPLPPTGPVETQGLPSD